MYLPSNRASKSIKQKWTDVKRETDTATVTENLILFPTINRTNGQIISKNIEDLNNIINQVDLNNIYKILYSTTTEHILFKYTQNIRQHRPYSGPEKKKF